jgi:hypothetical protein
MQALHLGEQLQGAISKNEGYTELYKQWVAVGRNTEAFESEGLI